MEDAQSHAATKSTDEQMSYHEALAVVSENGMALQRLPLALRGDPEIVLAAASRAVDALEFASEELRDSCDFVSKAIRQDIAALEFASLRLRGDRNFMQGAAEMDWRALRFADKALLRDRELVRITTEKNWQALSFTGEAMRSDRELLKVALDQTALALKYAGEPLRKDRNVVLDAVKQNWLALEFAAPCLQEDPEILLLATQQSWQALKFIPRCAKVELPVMLKAVKQNWEALHLFIGDIRSEAEFVELAKENPRIIQHPCLRGRRNVVKAAVETNGLALQHASPDLKSDKDIVTSALRQHLGALECASGAVQHDPCITELVSRLGEELQSRHKSPTPDNDVTVFDFDGVGSSSPSSSPDALHAAVAERLPRLLEIAVVSGSPSELAEEARRMVLRSLSGARACLFNLDRGCCGASNGVIWPKPCGWVHLAAKRDLTMLGDWPVAYFGTSVESAVRILVEGSPEFGEFTVSPSLEYAGHPEYATLARVGRGEWLQSVVQLRVRPGSYAVQPGTMINKHWEVDLRLDPDFPTLDNLEWAISGRTDGVVAGVLFREMGNGADPKVYGDSAARVAEGEHGPEVEWARLACERLREEGLRLRKLRSL